MACIAFEQLSGKNKGFEKIFFLDLVKNLTALTTKIIKLKNIHNKPKYGEKYSPIHIIIYENSVFIV